MQALTANRLRDGAVVYRTGGGQWSPRIVDAVIFEQDGAAALAAAEADVIENLVVGLDLIAVTRTPDGPKPVSLREQIRAYGPTI